MFDLFHVLTINALGCHLNFKLIFFFFWFMNIDIGEIFFLTMNKGEQGKGDVVRVKAL